jgi:hypothetical protein
MDTPIETFQQAHGQLNTEDEEEWEEGLESAGLALSNTFSHHQLHLLGMSACSDAVAGVCLRA